MKTITKMTTKALVDYLKITEGSADPKTVVHRVKVERELAERWTGQVADMMS